VTEPVEAQPLSTVSVPCENGSTSEAQAVFNGVHIPYDYNEVF
jgi:hypothetical protein